MPSTALPKVHQHVQQHETDAEAMKLIRRNGLESLAATATQLAGEHLPLACPMRLKLVHDPDSASQWIELEVSVAGDARSIRAAHKRYTRAWLALVPSERALDVRLAINLV